MQNNQFKTPLAYALDHLLRIVAAWMIGTAWFVNLWGLSLPALTAGAAFGCILWMGCRQLGKTLTARKEKLLRRQIGGELALEKLLLTPPQEAMQQVIHWISKAYPFHVQKTNGWTMIGVWDQRPALLHLISQHKSQAVTTQQIVECARAQRQSCTERCLVCVTAPISPEASLFASEAEPSIYIISREELISLAGSCTPATDEDLLNLRKQKRTRRKPKEWLAVILDASRAGRYFWYGMGMSLLALWTGSVYYAVPSALCLFFFIACKLHQRGGFTLLNRHWKG